MSSIGRAPQVPSARRSAPLVSLACAVLPLVPARITTTSIETPTDELIGIELGAHDQPLKGRGPSKVFPYTADFSGTLFVWAASEELDPCLRIEDEERRLLAEDNNSGGGTTACIARLVEPDQRLNVIVASSGPKGAGKLELHLIAAPENDATRAFADGAESVLSEIGEFRANGELDQARKVLSLLVAELEQLEGAERSALVVRACWQLGLAAYEVGDLDDVHELFEAVHAARERLLPPRSPRFARGQAESRRDEERAW